ncbi:MAG: 2-hydroxyacyl-CoA dehydratase [Ruminococcus sp.]|nr:2-hydroxyacyl-CoA dehydratase [Ruminococcus sp.]
MNLSRTQTLRHPYALGIDVGSTTVKAVILDQNHQMVYSNYQRHFSKVKETIAAQLRQIAGVYPGQNFPVCITGSAGLGLADSAKLPFVQEVHAAFVAVNQRFPDADAVIELGGEDAKIIFLTGGVEQRMNGSCAGGTGAFIDQMATLLNVTADQLDEMSLRAEKNYPIASRCGVFAKSDIQPLLNQGARREDIAASIFQAVVDQTVSGLAQGRTIQGKVLFLGGPLSFLEGLRRAFVKTLHLDPGNAVFPEDGRTFVAYGCALSAMNQTETHPIEALIEKISGAVSDSNVLADPPLFSYPEEYDRFRARHASHDVARGDFRTYKGKAFLGIDAGSTTTKMVVISEDRTLLYEYYTTNKGQPLDCITAALSEFYAAKSPELRIAGSAVTGYGEELLKAGLGLDHGIVETVAHFKAASFFCPEVDFIMDIGGQDIKCFKIKNGAIDSIMLNEACSSGCGSFIQTFAMALGYDIADFAKLGLFAERPVDLGSRCTVFMNSSVKQAQKDGATVADISAGLSGSIIKNAVYKVIRANSPDDLGKHIVVQGGTFLNDAVLRSFEREMGRDVIRPAISGLMGAFGAALYAQEKSTDESTLIDAEALRSFSYTSQAATCKGCTAHCSLNIVRFAAGGRFISGNRCERGAGIQPKDILPNLYDRKYEMILDLEKDMQPVNPIATVGLPLALHYYDQMPLWAAFFKKLNFQVKFSETSTRETYYKGQNTIPSDTVCYPAKLTHGHIESLLDQDVDFIFYPCMSYTIDEGESDNHFNCPVVAYYPELLMANNERLSCKNFLYPFLDLNRKKHVIHVLHEYFSAYATKKEIADALEAGFTALEKHRAQIAAEAQDIIKSAREAGKPIIVLAGRPYHIDPEINHGIHKLIASLGMAVITEDSIAALAHTPKLNALNQWVFHSRMYRAAEYVTTQPDMQLIQLVSFGCGIDAITTDEVRRILEEKGKLYTQLKIDEINNLGAAKIRLRSLVAAMDA